MPVTLFQSKPKTTSAAPLGAIGPGRPVARALEAWRQVLGAANVLSAEQAQVRYQANNLAVQRRLSGALLPKTTSHICSLVRVAAAHRIPLYPISTGRNWGYGSALPVKDDCIIVDCSGMTDIQMDPQLGLVMVEPGVTQGMLAAYLDDRKLPYLIPVTGAGPQASLLGNALERGFGITPHCDHFAAVTSLEAVLPDGQRYQGALTEAGCAEVDRAFKWGLGPYLDGLFTQGGFGIVTRMTIALAPKPERVEAFFFSSKNEDDLEQLTARVQAVLRRTAGLTSNINLMNRERILSMVAPNPNPSAPARRLPAQLVASLARKYGVATWSGLGALYGSRTLVRAAKQELKKVLKPGVDQLVFLTRKKTRWARWLTQRLPLIRNTPLADRCKGLDEALCFLEGRPSETALGLAYWKKKTGFNQNLHALRDPARDGSGLIWYSPLVPMKGDAVRTFVNMVRRICSEHGFDPLITLTSLNDRCFDSTIPILFQKNEEETARAHACYEALLTEGRRIGVHPYRLGVQSMKGHCDASLQSWQLGKTLKQAVDPHNIMAPGRYEFQSPPQSIQASGVTRRT